MGEERKLVTILFADVVGSTAMAGDNDPEVVRNVMGRYFQRLTEIAESHGGTVEKFAGDSVMVVFGVPAVHDDDAERAVRAALATRDAVAEMSPGLPIPLAVRVGVNSGEAVTAAREDRQFMVSGDPVNVAARLQQAAEPGEVVVGTLTHSLTRSAIEYEARAPIEARGKLDPIPAFAAVRPLTAVPTQARGIPGLRAALVGRQRELRLLVDTYGRVVEDRRPHLFTLVGSGGVGKSRLVAEALADPALAGATVFRGRCLPYGTGITYWPLIEMFGRRLPEAAVAETEWPAVRARLAVMLGQQAAATAMPDVPAEAVNREIVWALRRHFQALAAAGPLILVVDDLQWAEEALVDLVLGLTDRMAAVPLLLVTIARPELLEAHPTWGAGKPDATTLTLAPLNPEQTADLIGRLLAVDGLPDALRREVVARSEGTPLYCEEFLRMLIEEGSVVRDGDAWRARSADIKVAVPHSIQALLAARLDGLGEGEKMVLQAASVIGERFRLSELTALLAAEAPARLEGVVQKGMVVEGDAPDEFSFRHLLIRDAAYGSMPKSRRGDLHEAYARLLEAQEGAGEQLVGIMAHHFERAFSLARELLLPEAIVARRAQATLRSSMALFERAWARREVAVMDSTQGTAAAAAAALPDGGGPSIRAQLMMQEVQQALAAGDYDAARRRVETATELARQAGRQDLLAASLLVEMQVYSQAGGGHFDHLEELLGPAVAAFRALGDEQGEMEARYIAALRFWSGGDLVRVEEELTGLLARCREVGAEALSTGIRTRLAAVEFFRGNTEASVAHLQEAEKVALRLGLNETLGRLELGYGNAAMLTGSAAEAEAHFRRLLELTADRADAQVGGLRFLAYWFMFEGRFREAAEALDRAIAMSTSSGDRWNRSELYSLRARATLQEGDLEGAEAWVRLAREALTDGDVTAETELLHALAEIRMAQGRPEEAESELRRAQRLISPTQYQWPRTIVELGLADALAAQGRREEAGTVLDARQAWLEATGWRVWDPQIAAIRARIAG